MVGCSRFPPQADRPPSLWRLARLLHQRLCAALLDAPALTAILANLARLHRALAEPPRRRTSQLAAGKAKKLALTAAMRKLLVILNAMLRDGTPWQPEHSA